MIQQLSTQWMEPAELRAMIGDEAYFAAKALEEQDRDQKRLDKIYDQFHNNVFTSHLYPEVLKI